MTKAESKQAYQRLVANIREILIRHDSIGLIAGGASDDEYNAEATLISSALKKAKSHADVMSVLYDCFARSFGKDDVRSIDSFHAPAAEIWSKWLAFDAEEKRKRRAR